MGRRTRGRMEEMEGQAAPDKIDSRWNGRSLAVRPLDGCEKKEERQMPNKSEAKPSTQDGRRIFSLISSMLCLGGVSCNRYATIRNAPIQPKFSSPYQIPLCCPSTLSTRA